MHPFNAPGPALRRGLAVALTVTLALAATACGQNGGGPAAGSGDGSTAVRVGVIPIVDVAPIYLGVDEGLFEEQGLDVSLVPAQGGSAIVPGVVSGQFQFGCGTPPGPTGSPGAASCAPSSGPRRCPTS